MSTSENNRPRSVINAKQTNAKSRGPYVGTTSGAPADRRVLAGVNAAGSAPSGATDGYNTQNDSYVIVDYKNLDGSASYSIQAYLYNNVSGIWVAEAAISIGAGVAGRQVYKTYGLDRVAVICSAGGGSGNGVDVWISTLDQLGY